MTSDYLRTKYLIIGAGLSGLSAAYHLKEDYVLTESTNSLGGTAGTLHYKNFKLDNAVHILYFKHKRILNWVKNELQIELLEEERESSIWIDDTYVKFPIQYNLRDLPTLSKFLSFVSICKTLNLNKKSPHYNKFEDYSLNVFGKYLTDIFVRPYNEKLSGTELDKMNIGWMGDYVPAYSKFKMMLSITKLVNSNYGRNIKFYYPSEGGISTIAQRICTKLTVPPIHSYSLTKIFLNKKIAVFNNGIEIKYNYLINTIPLDSFLQKIDNLPSDISYCAGLLKKNSTTILHLLVNGNVSHKNYHWVYVPNEVIPFYRITFPETINPANCPAGYSAITLEFGGNVYKHDEIVSSSLNALEKMGILKENKSNIEFCWRLINCGYVIYDDKREGILRTIFPFLKNNQVWSIGRYGSWEYSNMENAILQGKMIADKLKTYT